MDTWQDCWDLQVNGSFVMGVEDDWERVVEACWVHFVVFVEVFWHAKMETVIVPTYTCAVSVS